MWCFRRWYMNSAESLDNEQSDIIIVLDDDESIAKLIEKFSGLKAIGFLNMATLEARIAEYSPTAVFVDVHLTAGEIGLDFIPKLRKSWPNAVFIVITSDTSDGVITDALSSGADDFVQKPIRKEELVSRLRLRLSEMEKNTFDSVLHFEDITVELSHRSIRKESKIGYLSNTEMSLLVALIKSNGMVLSRDELKRKCWGRVNVTDGALDRKMHEVRRALTDVGSGIEIKSIYGKGFIVK